VDQDVTGPDAMAARVPGFGIVPGEHECRESAGVLVTRKDLVGRVMRMCHSAASGAGRCRTGIGEPELSPRT
jgi:hypothetical protein